ncbi:unnamed protein product [Paramecium sonneborni]|uniref:Peptidase C1A papain C-terminal domain-containing protein n=1 Tax=Paramecium sonneborni TaxID=65129 RepID=A0A8S1Q9F6_9CILI|nr:unnamed protein product [Paramecium sonneborni]
MNRYTILTIILTSCLLIFVTFVTLDQTPSFLTYRPKEYDVTLITQVENCDQTVFLEGLCQGGNWAHIFTQTLYLTNCLRSSSKQPRLSAEELLQCTKWDEDKCSATPKSIRIVNNIKNFLIENGLTTNKCLSYKQTVNFNLKNKCPIRCDDLSFKKPELRAKNLLELQSTQDIQDHIINKGPVVLALKYGSSLNEYSSGLYTTKNDDQDFGIRFLMIVGWHTEMDGKITWKSLNSFGNQYGVDGRVNVGEKNEYILGYFGFDV